MGSCDDLIIITTTGSDATRENIGRVVRKFATIYRYERDWLASKTNNNLRFLLEGECAYEFFREKMQEISTGYDTLKEACSGVISIETLIVNAIFACDLLYRFFVKCKKQGIGGDNRHAMFFYHQVLGVIKSVIAKNYMLNI